MVNYSTLHIQVFFLKPSFDKVELHIFFPDGLHNQKNPQVVYLTQIRASIGTTMCLDSCRQYFKRTTIGYVIFIRGLTDRLFSSGSWNRTNLIELMRLLSSPELYPAILSANKDCMSGFSVSDRSNSYFSIANFFQGYELFYNSHSIVKRLMLSLIIIHRERPHVD